ncbi:hypothetical protein ACTJJ4_12725 [Microbacterium sp. 22195]|uniref:hypothetical protein n=1 Tax=Microbacterium sp. 22195 TaxID=3453891 RepID=UPI003F859F3E
MNIAEVGLLRVNTAPCEVKETGVHPLDATAIGTAAAAATTGTDQTMPLVTARRDTAFASPIELPAL